MVGKSLSRQPLPIISLITINRFKEWPTIFPGAACVAALIDRLIHHCETLVIEGDSYRCLESMKEKRCDYNDSEPH